MNPSAELHRYFTALDYAEIQRLITDQEEEGIHTEYKEASPHQRGQLAKALSGFANADGGLIVWGIATEKGPNGGDRAHREVPVRDPRALRVTLEAVTVNATEPPVHGVEHREIPHPNGGGFVATLIPASDSGPHMAMLEHRRFYRRDPIGHHPMSQSEIGDMFGRRPRAVLDVAVVGTRANVIKAVRPAYAHHTASIEVRCVAFLALSNKGRGLARFPSVKVVITPADVYTLNLVEDAPTLRRIASLPVEPLCVTLIGGSDDVVHSGTHMPLAAIESSIWLKDGDNGPLPNRNVPDLRMSCTVTAEGLQPESRILVVPGTQFLAAALATLVDDRPLAEWFARWRPRLEG